MRQGIAILKGILTFLKLKLTFLNRLNSIFIHVRFP